MTLALTVILKVLHNFGNVTEVLRLQDDPLKLRLLHRLLLRNALFAEGVKPIIRGERNRALEGISDLSAVPDRCPVGIVVLLKVFCGPL